MNIFSQIKEAVSAKDAAPFYGLRVTPKGMCCCPFHDDHHPSMKIDRYYYCFACGAKGDVINLVSHLLSLSPIEAAKRIISDFDLDIPLSSGGHTNTGQPGVTHHPPGGKKSNTDDLERAFHLYRRDVLFLLHEYLHLLQSAKRDRRPKNPGEPECCDPLFEEALNNLDFIDFLIDTLTFGSTLDQLEALQTYEGRIQYVKNRLNELKQ